MQTKINYTQYQKIITLMARYPQKEWWLPSDFMQDTLDYLFVGYEASARLSELARQYPDMIATQQQGKYKARRLCFESIDQWLPLLAKDLRYALHRLGFKSAPQHEAPPAPAPPELTMIEARYRGRTDKYFTNGITYELQIEKLVMFQPVRVHSPMRRDYAGIKSFQADWLRTK